MQHATAGHGSPDVVRIKEALGNMVDFPIDSTASGARAQLNERGGDNAGSSIGFDVDGHNKPTRAWANQSRRDSAQQPFSEAPW